MTQKIAFCFLLYNKIQHAQIWHNFFNFADRSKYTAYAHFKTFDKESPLWLTKVNTVGTGWCGEGLIHGFSQMIKEGLKDPDNKFFILLSGSDIPLYNFNRIYSSLIKSKLSRVNYHWGEIFPDYEKYLADQWVILNREDAKTYARLSDKKDKKAQAFKKDIKDNLKKRGLTIMQTKHIEKPKNKWIGGCPDEIYPINWFKENGVTVSNRPSTYTYWDSDLAIHPFTFGLKDAKYMKKYMKRSGALFARKFRKNAAEYIAMSL